MAAVTDHHRSTDHCDSGREKERREVWNVFERNRSFTMLSRRRRRKREGSWGLSPYMGVRGFTGVGTQAGRYDEKQMRIHLNEF